MDAKILSALSSALSGTPSDSFEAQEIRQLASGLIDRGCTNIEEKLAEYNKCGGRIGNLKAELRLATALSDHFHSPAEFLVKDGADFRFHLGGKNVFVEAENLSSIDEFSEIFNPDPANLDDFEKSSERWKKASAHLHQILKIYPFEIQPWVDGEIQNSAWGGKERALRLEVCAMIAESLAKQLPKLDHTKQHKIHIHSVRFDIKPLPNSPGRILGQAPLEAHFVHDHPLDGMNKLSMEEWIRNGIIRKSQMRARKRIPPDESNVYLVGLVIDEAIAYPGRTFLTSLLGGLISDPPKLYRKTNQEYDILSSISIRRGRSDLLKKARWSPTIRTSDESELGLLFDSRVKNNADGIVAMYYTGDLHFVPNLFVDRDIDSIFRLFPPQFRLFGEDD